MEKNSTDRSLFTWTRHNGGDSVRQLPNVVLVVLESFRSVDVDRKLKNTLLYLRDKFYVRSELYRIGINSIPNRCPLFTGLPMRTKISCTKTRNGTLQQIAEQNLFSSFVGEVRGQHGHYSNMMQVLFESQDPQMKSNTRRLLGREWCELPQGCRKLPYPVEYPRHLLTQEDWAIPPISTSCFNRSVHEIVFGKLINFLRGGQQTFAMVNLYDFHPPNLQYVSDDLDEGLAAFLETVHDTYTFILGDHGHGLGLGGQSGLLVVPPRPSKGLECLQQFDLTTHSVYTAVSNLLSGRPPCSKTSEFEAWIDRSLFPLQLPSNCNINIHTSLSEGLTCKLRKTTCAGKPFDTFQFIVDIACASVSAVLDVRFVEQTGLLTVLPSSSYQHFHDCVSTLSHGAWLNLTLHNGKYFAVQLDHISQMPLIRIAS